MTSQPVLASVVLCFTGASIVVLRRGRGVR